MPDVSLRSVDCRGEQRQRQFIYGRSAPDAMQEVAGAWVQPCRADEDEANGVRTSAPCRVVRLHARPGQRRGRRLGVIHWARVSRSLISAIGSELYKQCVSSNAYQDSSQKIKMRIKIQELTDVIRITTRQPKVVQQRLFRKLFNREGTKSYYSLLN